MNIRLILYILGISALVGSISQNIYTPILPEIQRTFHTTPYLTNLTISVFTIALAIMQIVYGPFIDSKGRKKILLPSMLLYVVASIGCAFSSSIYALLLFRTLQGIGAAAIPVVAATVIGDLFEGKQRGKALSTYQMLLSLASVIGPLIGGFIGAKSGHFGVFFFLSISGLILLLLNLRFLPETKPENGQTRKLSLTRFSTIARNSTGLAVLVLGFTQFYTFYSFLVFLPSILNHIYSISPEKIGVAFLPLSLCVMLGSFLSGRLQGDIKPTNSLLYTCLLNVLSVVLFIALAHVSIVCMIIIIALYGLTVGFSMPIQSRLLTDEFLHERATAISMYNFVRYIGMAIGPIAGSFLVQGGNFFLPFSFAALLFGGAILFSWRWLQKTEQSCSMGADT
ncbi:MFS transporter [Aneurinibacillus aneurinilyticus]|uniref:Transporter, major facilitator family protein n=1 Tax=Aneurinibacillus aneurinilyticus ATCC 12856 TaxID=649747 RepID=U1YCQ6_ANEAE|nr:MFS transporter [Aneurinibacillus aneurinilyticus]ERI08591.1 transporter, major facilitator family protein [Aneurinibacillus aneurinilyticus ATCC 12856]MED0706117.1 MFS transporter [Aneurinibacillus aneurinilyticus]MED0725091.1 MFS transporter [Aneurinibacillus aneurinilyticus]MED0732691.1 MFS transporter [Aneurinibacillus aneurinilyticus]MED0739828.1 MFS transporter [Aneurinibacillus aneurinilyticus]